ncbi:MAG: hypothetical protein AAGE84_05760 [Cyanobacteria bacterium P01_G01_bin.39]
MLLLIRRATGSINQISLALTLFWQHSCLSSSRRNATSRSHRRHRRRHRRICGDAGGQQFEATSNLRP